MINDKKKSINILYELKEYLNLTTFKSEMT